MEKNSLTKILIGKNPAVQNIGKWVGAKFFPIFALIIMMIFALFAGTVLAADEKNDWIQPTIVSTHPSNNEKYISRNEYITVTFSEPIDPTTVNSNTFKIMQRTTPADDDKFRADDIKVDNNDLDITYSGNEYTFRPKYTPNQEFGNVFTITLTTGITDLAGNPLARDYSWSFTTGADPYNTGASTSQLDQSPTQSTPTSSTTPVVTTTVPTTPIVTQTETTGFPWVWVIAGAVFLLLLALIIGASRSSSSRLSSKTTTTSDFGDVHPVKDIEGIGSVYNRSLQSIGINNTAQLWKANATKVSQSIGAPVKTVKSWQNMAELASVKSIGPQYAELLERSGVHSIEQLKNYESEELFELIQQKQESLDVNIVGHKPGESTVKNWIEPARVQSSA